MLTTSLTSYIAGYTPYIMQQPTELCTASNETGRKAWLCLPPRRWTYTRRMFSTLSPAVAARRCLERARRPQGDPAARDSDLELEQT